MLRGKRTRDIVPFVEIVLRKPDIGPTGSLPAAAPVIRPKRRIPPEGLRAGPEKRECRFFSFAHP